MYLYATSYLVSTWFNPEKSHSIIPLGISPRTWFIDRQGTCSAQLTLGWFIDGPMGQHHLHLRWFRLVISSDFYARFINGFWEHVPENIGYFAINSLV